MSAGPERDRRDRKYLSDEILFAARIHPARPANTLTAEEWNRLASAIPERLAFFIEKTRLRRRNIWRQKAGITATRRFYRSMGTAANLIQSAEKFSAAL